MHKGIIERLETLEARGKPATYEEFIRIYREADGLSQAFYTVEAQCNNGIFENTPENLIYRGYLIKAGIIEDTPQKSLQEFTETY